MFPACRAAAAQIEQAETRDKQGQFRRLRNRSRWIRGKILGEHGRHRHCRLVVYRRLACRRIARVRTRFRGATGKHERTNNQWDSKMTDATSCQSWRIRHFSRLVLPKHFVFPRTSISLTDRCFTDKHDEPFFAIAMPYHINHIDTLLTTAWTLDIVNLFDTLKHS